MTGYLPGVHDIPETADEIAGNPGIGPDYEWHRELTGDIAADNEDMRYLP